MSKVKLYISEQPQVEEPFGIELESEDGTIKRLSGIVTSITDNSFNYVIQDVKTKAEIDKIPPMNITINRSNDWVNDWNKRSLSKEQ